MRAQAITIMFAVLVAVGLPPLVGGCDKGGDDGGADPGGDPGPNPLTPIAYDVYEGQSATIRVSRQSGYNGAVAVRYSVVDGTATHGADYGDPTGVGTLSWPSGTSGPFSSFSIPTIADGVAEGPETVVIRLSDASGGATIATTETTLTIWDPPQRDVLQFSAAEYTAYERLGNTTATFTVRRLEPSDATVTVHYAVVSGGTASSGDIGALSGTGTLSWPLYDGSERTFTVPVLDDGGPNEGVETVLLALSSPTGGAVLGSPSTATLWIVDAPGAIRVASEAYTVAEGSGALVNLERVGGARGIVTATYTVAPGTATGPSAFGPPPDYSAPSEPVTTSWADGDMFSKSFVVLTSNDTPANELDETVLISLTGDVTAPTSATITITDRPGTLAFAYARMGVYEYVPYMYVPVKRTGGSRGAASVACTTSNGTAIAGTHYTATTTTLTWASGDANDKNCTVPLQNDGVARDGEQFFHLSLSAPTGASLGSTSTATVSIMDSAGTFVFYP